MFVQTACRHLTMLLKCLSTDFFYPLSHLVTLVCMYIRPQVHRACLCSAHVFMLSFCEVLWIFKIGSWKVLEKPLNYWSKKVYEPWEGALANQVTQLSKLNPGRANFSYISLENVLKRLHSRQGNPPSWGTLCTCPRHPSRRAIFLPCKQFVLGHSASRAEKTVIFRVISKAALNVNCH